MTLTFDFLPATAFAFFLIFARIGPMVMVLPGIGDRMVPVQVRLIFALTLTLVLYPIILPKLPSLPNFFGHMSQILIGEIIIGLAIGILVRMIAAGLQIAGTVISFQSGLSFAQTVNVSTGGSEAIFSSFLTMLAITIIFTMDLHHLILMAMYDSYTMFPPNTPWPIGDFNITALEILAGSFRIGLQISTPFIIFGLIFFLGLGILSRFIPQIQVFFIAMPANIFLGFLLFAILISSMMVWYLQYYETALLRFIE